MTPPRTEAPPAARTRAEFIGRWRAQCLILGMDALTILSGPPQLKERKAEAVMGLPAQIDGLLGRMYDDLMFRPAPANGQPAKGVAK